MYLELNYTSVLGSRTHSADMWIVRANQMSVCLQACWGHSADGEGAGSCRVQKPGGFTAVPDLFLANVYVCVNVWRGKGWMGGWGGGRKGMNEWLSHIAWEFPSFCLHLRSARITGMLSHPDRFAFLTWCLLPVNISCELSSSVVLLMVHICHSWILTTTLGNVWFYLTV